MILVFLFVGKVFGLNEGEECPDTGCSLSTMPKVPTQHMPVDVNAYISARLGGKGFNCQKKEETGMECVGNLPSYPLPVHLYFPAGFKPEQDLDLALHFTGFDLDRDHRELYFGGSNKSDFVSYLKAASNTSTIVIVPESKGNAEGITTYAQNLKQPEQATAFLNQVTELLKEAGAAKTSDVKMLAVSAHSGSYELPVAWANAVQKGSQFDQRYFSKIYGVGFFDAVYGRPEPFVKLAKLMAERKGTFFSVYEDGNNGTRKGNEAVMNILKAKAQPLGKADGPLNNDLHFFKAPETEVIYRLPNENITRFHMNSVSATYGAYLRSTN